MNNWAYYCYKTAAAILPAKIRNKIGGSKIFEPLRNGLLRDKGIPKIISGQIKFEGLHFIFQAPFQTFHHAEKSGIESKLSRLIMSQCKSGSVCIDVGTNYGFISLIMAMSAKPNGKVFSFECDPDIIKIFEETLRKNNLEKFGESALAAIGSAPGTTLDEKILTTTVDRVDLIKIDTDGSDYQVLRGAAKIIQKYRPLIIVEMMENQKEIYDFLSPYYSFLYGMDGEIAMPPHWPANLIASTKEVSIPPRGFFEKKSR